jgi:hypothetical protein
VKKMGLRPAEIAARRHNGVLAGILMDLEVREPPSHGIKLIQDLLGRDLLLGSRA